MARDVNGDYTLPTNDSSPAAPRNVIRSSDFNEITSDLATALTDSWSRSGKGEALADLDMGGFSLLNEATMLRKAQNLNDVADKAAARFNLKVSVYVADRTVLKALDTTKDALVYLKEDGREGIFEWTAGDFSAQITADTLEGLYLKADAIASTAGAWVRAFNGPAYVTWFGAVGDGTTDDATAIQAALTWWGTGENRHVDFNKEKRFLMNSGVSVNCDGVMSPGSVIMHGSVKSAANVAALFTFTNVRGGRFRLRVYGGGQTADYSQADPVGKNEAFRFVNAYGSIIEYVEGIEYAGRVLRMTSTTPGSGGFRTQWIDIGAIYVNSSAAISASEATRLAAGVGQSAYIDSGTVAFGIIRSWISMWEKYGPVIRDTTDITLLYMESLWRSIQGFQLEGVTSFHGGKLNLGSELVLFDVMRIRNGTADSSNIVIDELLVIGGTYGLRVENVGTIAGPGIKINSLMTRQNTRGVTLSGCSKCEINLHSWDDEIAFESSGTCDNIQVHCMITASKKQAILVSSGSSNIHFTGSAYNGNTSATATTSLVDILATNPIFFDGFIASSGNVDMLYDVPASNNTVIRGGRATVAGGTVTHVTQPRQVSDVVGWKTKARGTVTWVAAGSPTTVVITHGLATTPEQINITGLRAEAQSWWISARTTTTFTVSFPAATPADTTLIWEAAVPYAIN